MTRYDPLMETCAYCDGKGFVRKSPWGRPWREDLVECDECAGTGEVEDDATDDDGDGAP